MFPGIARTWAIVRSRTCTECRQPVRITDGWYLVPGELRVYHDGDCLRARLARKGTAHA